MRKRPCSSGPLGALLSRPKRCRKKQAVDCRLRGRSHLREARRALLRVACAMPRASACGSSWLSVESRRVALATIATPSRADAPRRRPVAAVRHATAAEAPATHWAGRQKARAALASATRLMSESDRGCLVRAYDATALRWRHRLEAALLAMPARARASAASHCPSAQRLDPCTSAPTTRRPA